MSKLKEEARKLIDKLPDTATWDDIMYEFYVKSKIDEGIKAAQDGDVLSHEEVKAKFFSE